MMCLETLRLVHDCTSKYSVCLSLVRREKYVDIILKMEEMLKSWFPHIKLQDQLTATQTDGAVSSKRFKVNIYTLFFLIRERKPVVLKLFQQTCAAAKNIK